MAIYCHIKWYQFIIKLKNTNCIPRTNVLGGGGGVGGGGGGMVAGVLNGLVIVMLYPQTILCERVNIKIPERTTSIFYM